MVGVVAGDDGVVVLGLRIYNVSLSVAGRSPSELIKPLRSLSSSIECNGLSKFVPVRRVRKLSSFVASVLLATFSVDLRQADLSFICG